MTQNWAKMNRQNNSFQKLFNLDIQNRVKRGIKNEEKWGKNPEKTKIK